MTTLEKEISDSNKRTAIRQAIRQANSLGRLKDSTNTSDGVRTDYYEGLKRGYEVGQEWVEDLIGSLRIWLDISEEELAEMRKEEQR